VPQLLIHWSVQKNYITIPKSTKPERILENTNVFDFTISDKDMTTLVGLISLTCMYYTRECACCVSRIFRCYPRSIIPLGIQALCSSVVLECSIVIEVEFCGDESYNFLKLWVNE